MTFESIKDSGRIVGLSGSRCVYKSYYIQIAENTDWYSDIIDTEGLTLFNVFIFNYSSSPAALASATVQFSNSPTFATPPIPAYRSFTAPAVGSAQATSTPEGTKARYMRVYVKSGATAGTYTIAVYVVVNP